MKHKILLVDDEPTNIRLLRETLKGEYSLLIAKNGPDALRICTESKPELVLLDIMMPEMSGYEVCRKIKANPATVEIRVIFVTAKVSAEDETMGLDLGAVDYITKPIRPAILKARVKVHLELYSAQRKMKRLSDQLSHYISPQLYQSIFEGKRDSTLGVRRRKLTIFFSDIVDFTARTDNMEPEDLNHILNGYLSRMTEIVLKHGGTLDKFMGDGILVFFGDPETRGVREDALACVNMALEMRDSMGALRQAWSDNGIDIPFSVRMGISTGYCTVGNFGSDRKMEYTVIGGYVNLASRLESSAAPNQILISQDTWSLVQNEVRCVRLPSIQVKGFAQAVPIFEVVGLESGLSGSRRVVESLQGFSLHLDPDVVESEASRREIRASLEEALAQLESPHPAKSDGGDP